MAIKISGSTIIDDSRNIVNAGVITATDAVITGDLTVQGTTTTIDTNLIGVDRIEVGANSSSFPAIAVTQSGSANLAHFYNSSGNTALVLTNSNRLGIGTDSPKTQLEVLGEFSISNASEPGYGSSIRTYEPASNPDIVNLVPGSTFGTLFESTKNGHLVFGIRDNDTIDSVSIVSGSGNYAADSTYDKAIARFQADGKVGIGLTFIAGGPGLHVAGIVTSSKLQVYGTGIVSTTSSDAAFRVTQAGTGHAFVVEDATNPDESPFVIEKDGRISIGSTLSGGKYAISIVNWDNPAGTAATYYGISQESYRDSGSGSWYINKSARGTPGSPQTSNQGDVLSGYYVEGHDGNEFSRSSRILFHAGRDIGLGTMSGYITLGTKKAGDAGITNRLVVNEYGDFIIGTNPLLQGYSNQKLQVHDSGAYFNGNVGIGSTTPSADLDIVVNDPVSVPFIIRRTDVAAKITARFGGGDSLFKYTVNDASSYVAGIDDGDVDKFKISYGSADDASFGTNDYLTVQANGYVGINTSDAVRHLTVSGTNESNLVLKRTDGGGDQKYWRILNNHDLLFSSVTDDFNTQYTGYQIQKGTGAGIGTHTWYTGTSTQRIILDSDGKLGIGTNLVSGARLNIYGDVGVDTPLDFWSYATTYYAINGNYGSLAHQGGFEISLTSNGYRNLSNQWTSYGVNGLTGASKISLNPNGYIRFLGDAVKANGSSSDPTFRMGIDASGNLGLGSNLSGSIASGFDADFHIQKNYPHLRLTSTNSIAVTTNDELISYIEFEGNDTGNYVLSGAIVSRQDFGNWSSVTPNIGPSRLEFYVQGGGTDNDCLIGNTGVESAIPAMVINRNHYVGVGTISPRNLGHFVRNGQARGVDHDQATLRVEGGDSYDSEIYLTGSDTHVGQIRFGDATSSYRGAVNYYHNGDYLTLVSGGAEHVRYSAYNQYHNVGVATFYSQEGTHFSGQYTVTDQLYLDNYRGDIGSAGFGGNAIVFNHQDSNNGGVNEGRIKSVASNAASYFGSASETSCHFLFEVSNGGTPTDVLAITSLGRVGINTNNPDASLEIAASFPTIRLKDADTNAYSDIDGNGANLILKADRSGTVSNSSIQFNIDVSEVARFTSDQYLRFASGSSGIQFDGATAADDALDAYEEGSWNPDVRSSTTSIKTYTNAGYYVRIGNLVHCGLEILDNSFSTALTGEIRIYGLPFTPSNGRVNTMSPISYNGAFGNADFIGQLDMSSSTYVRIYTDPGAAGALTVNLIPTVYRIYAQFTYTIA